MDGTSIAFILERKLENREKVGETVGFGLLVYQLEVTFRLNCLS